MVAEAEALDRESTHAEVAACLIEIGPAEHVNAFAVGEVDPQRVETRAQDRHAEARAVCRILQREEDALPARVAPQLGHLAFDPDRRQPREPVCDAAVERADRVDALVAVLNRIDLHPRCPSHRCMATILESVFGAAGAPDGLQRSISAAVSGVHPALTSSTARCVSASLPAVFPA